MLEYGSSYLEQNEAVLAQLAQDMSPEAYAFAQELAADMEEEDSE